MRSYKVNNLLDIYKYLNIFKFTNFVSDVMDLILESFPQFVK